MYSQACNCLACFHKSYVLGDKQPGPQSADLEFGTAMHSAINAIWHNEEGEDVFNVHWESLRDKELTYSRFKYDDLRDLGVKFCRRFKSHYAHRFSIDKAEIRLQGDFEGLRLNGQFDYYGGLDGDLALLDLKTSAYNYPAEKKDVALQLNLYAYLMLQNGYEPPSKLGYIVLSKGGGSIQAPLTWDFNEATCLAFVKDMVSYCRLYDGLTEYPRNPNEQRHNYECYTKGRE